MSKKRLPGTLSRSNDATDARSLVRHEVGELLQCALEVEGPVKIGATGEAQCSRECSWYTAWSDLVTWSPWAVRQQGSSHSQTCSQRASRSKCPLRKLLPIVLRVARCRSHRRTRALLRSVTSLHCRVDVCRETPRIMPGVWRASRDGLCPSRILQYYPWHGFGSLDSGPGGHCGPRYVYTLQTHLPTLVTGS